MPLIRKLRAAGPQASASQSTLAWNPPEASTTALARTVQGWPATLRRVLRLDFDTVIPGHGATTDRAGIVEFKSFLEQLGELARHAARDYTSLKQFLRTRLLTLDRDLEDVRMIIPIGLNRKFVLRRAWEETTGNFTPTFSAEPAGGP